jgi:micrococcal nuclease
MLNGEIIKAGYAGPMTIPPNVKYQDRFLKLYREAREAKRGLFKE